MMHSRKWLVCSVLLTACGPERPQVSLEVPSSISQALGSFDDLRAVLRVYDVDAAYSDPRQKEPRLQSSVEINGGAITHEIELKPAQYLVAITFEDHRGSGQDLALLEQSLTVQVVVGEATTADMSKGGVYKQFDHDGDGVPNLDEIRLGLDPELSPELWSTVLVGDLDSTSKQGSLYVADGTNLAATVLWQEKYSDTYAHVTQQLAASDGSALGQAKDAWLRLVDAPQSRAISSVFPTSPIPGVDLQSVAGVHLQTGAPLWSTAPMVIEGTGPVKLFWVASDGTLWAFGRATTPCQCSTQECVECTGDHPEWSLLRIDTTTSPAPVTAYPLSDGTPQPAVAAEDRMAYFRDFAETQQSVVMMDVSTGAAVESWEYVVGTGMHPDAAASLALGADGTVYVLWLDDLIAVKDGAESWRLNLGTTGSRETQALGSGILVTSWGDIAVRAGTELISVSPSGTERWRQFCGGDVDPSAPMGEGPNETILAQAAGGSEVEAGLEYASYRGLHAFDRNDGTIVAATTYEPLGPPVTVGDRTFVVIEREVFAQSSDPASGEAPHDGGSSTREVHAVALQL